MEMHVEPQEGRLAKHNQELLAHNDKLRSWIDGWAMCDKCKKWRKPSVDGIEKDVKRGDKFICGDMGANCGDAENKDFTSIWAFLGKSAHERLSENEILQNGYIDTACHFLVFKAEEEGFFQGDATQFIDRHIVRTPL